MPYGEVVHMAGMGAITSVLAPAAVLAARGSAVLRGLSWPAWAALPFFLLLHAGLTLGMELGHPRAAVHLLLDAALFTGAVIFWAPVLGTGRHRLDDAGRGVYLFLAAPSLDLAAVVVVATGNAAGGLAMIVAMLPIGLAAVALTWRWVREEEATAVELERISG